MTPRGILGLGAAFATLVATGFALVVVACGGDEKPAPSPSAPPTATGTAGTAAEPAAAPGAPPAAPAAPAAAPAPSAAAKRPAFLSAAECGKCHAEIYAEWKASWHGQAMTDPLFLRLTDGLKQEECIRCHAPVALRETENWETPIARTDRREDAISCLTCHQSKGNVAGPFGGLTGACRPVEDADQRDATKVCFTCHNQHKTGDEWAAGPYHTADPARPKEPKSCIDCHMPWVDRPLVAGGEVRHGRRHTWPGGHDMEQLKKAPVLEVETAAAPKGGTRITTWVTNTGAGHNIPTDARHRSFDVYVKVWDADGKVVLDPLDPDPTMQARCQATKFRLNYRNSGIPDTQVPPLARASAMPLGAEKPTWPGYVDTPVSKGRGEAWLVYRLTPEDALVPESLTDPAFHPYRARRVVSVPFTFGAGG